MFKSRILAIILILIVLIMPFTFSDDLVRVIVGEEEIEFSDSTGYPFISESNKALVPFRALLEKLDIQVSWDDHNRHAIGIKDGVKIVAPIGENRIYRNGTRIESEQGAQLINGKTYLPIRVVMEALDYKVSWDNDKWAVVIHGQEILTKEEILAQELDGKLVLDYRLLNKVTYPKDQGKNNTCWAFAGLGALEGSIANKEKYNFSEDHLINNTLYKVDYESGGYSDMVTSYLAAWKGPVLESSDPYGDGKTNREAKVIKHVQDILYIDNDVQEIKKALSSYGPVQSSMYVSDPENGDNEDVNYNKISSGYYSNEKRKSNHDVVIVGYDDHYKRSNFNKKPIGDGAYIVKNSWGIDWGEEGYFYVSYYDKNIGDDSLVFLNVEATDNYKNIYQYDEAGVTTVFGFDHQNYGYMANVFIKNEAAESLEGISFYTLNSDTKYELYVVEDYNEVDNLNAKKRLVGNGTIEHRGYHTIKLEEEIELLSRKFAVVVRLESDGGNLPIGIEESTNKTQMLPINYGVSFVSGDGSRWTDIQETYEDSTSNGSICIKAFTN